MSQGVSVLGGKCPGGKCPGGKCQGGTCPGGGGPRTKHNIKDVCESGDFQVSLTCLVQQTLRV